MNKRRKRRLVVSVILVVSILVLFVGLIFNVVDRLTFTKAKALSRINRDWDEISLVANFLIHSEKELIYLQEGYWDEKGDIEQESKALFLDNGAQDAYDAAKQLIIYQGYSNIVKSNNQIEFQMWTWFTGKSKGVVYSINGNVPRIDYVTKLEPLGILGWYYYERDYNR